MPLNKETEKKNQPKLKGVMTIFNSLQYNLLKSYSYHVETIHIFLRNQIYDGS